MAILAQATNLLSCSSRPWQSCYRRQGKVGEARARWPMGGVRLQAGVVYSCISIFDPGGTVEAAWGQIGAMDEPSYKLCTLYLNGNRVAHVRYEFIALLLNSAFFVGFIVLRFLKLLSQISNERFSDEQLTTVFCACVMVAHGNLLRASRPRWRRGRCSRTPSPTAPRSCLREGRQ